ncbi:MAG: hypothetical protein QGG23_08300 [Candidatus Bathyarchaeota archaeon]|jgi:hypothetical protein|nr:hypothetical protein [Candidatus Bathyarchaeota archaeon]
MKSLVVVPSGRRKIWEMNPNARPTLAKNVYTGPPFKVNREYAETFSDKWVILSPKYGFIEPDFIISEDYDVRFDVPKTNPIELSTLREQVKDRFSEYPCIVALGGSTYANLVVETFKSTDRKVLTPSTGIMIARAVRDAIRENKPFTCT